MIRYVPYSGASWEVVVGEIRNFAALGRKTAVISTINGKSNLGFFQEFGAQEINAASVPVMSFTVGERELASMPSRLLEGHMATWSYFSLGKSPQMPDLSNPGGSLRRSGTRRPMIRWKRQRSASGCGPRLPSRQELSTSTRFARPCTVRRF